MIKVLVGPGFRLRMDGHAGADRVNGYDLVCAAASTLCFTLAFACNSGCADLADGAVMSKGRADMTLVPAPGKEQETSVRFDTVVRGLVMLEEKYPACISVEGATE